MRRHIFWGVFAFGLAVMCGAEGVADRIRDSQGTVISQWIHMMLALGALLVASYEFSKAFDLHERPR